MFTVKHALISKTSFYTLNFSMSVYVHMCMGRMNTAIFWLIVTVRHALISNTGFDAKNFSVNVYVHSWNYIQRDQINNLEQ